MEKVRVVRDELRAFDFTDAEEKIVETLSFMQNVSVSKLSRKADVPRTTVYSALLRLKERGFVRRVRKGQRSLWVRLFVLSLSLSLNTVRNQNRSKTNLFICFIPFLFLCSYLSFCVVVVHSSLYVYYLLLFFHSVRRSFFLIPAFLYCVYICVVYVSLWFLFYFCCSMCYVLCASFCLLLCVALLSTCFPVVLLDYRVNFILLLCTSVMYVLYFGWYMCLLFYCSRSLWSYLFVLYYVLLFFVRVYILFLSMFYFFS